MHYNTIKFNIKIPLNIHNFHFCGALRAKSFILRLCARSAPIFFAIFQILPPQSEKWIDATALPPWGFHESAPLKENPGYALAPPDTHTHPPSLASLVRAWSLRSLACPSWRGMPGTPLDIHSTKKESGHLFYLNYIIYQPNRWLV